MLHCRIVDSAKTLRMPQALTPLPPPLPLRFLTSRGYVKVIVSMQPPQFTSDGTLVLEKGSQEASSGPTSPAHCGSCSSTCQATSSTADGKSPSDEASGKVTLHFQVVDTGAGIPEVAINRLFRPFVQVR